MIKLHVIAAAALVYRAGAITAGQMIKHSETVMDAVLDGNLQEVERLIDDMNSNPQYYWFQRLALNPQFCPLHVAAVNNDEPMVALLLRKGADVSTRDGENTTALYCAARAGAREIVEQLLDGGAKIDELIDVKTSMGTESTTALHIAATNGHASTVQLLLERGGGATNFLTGRGWDALHLAANTGESAVVDLLLKSGYSANNAHAEDRIGSQFGTGALHLAAVNGTAYTVELLLDAGAGVNSRTKRGNTPLFYAVNTNKIDVIRLLLSRGADPTLGSTILNGSYWTPTQLAQHYNYDEAAALLEDAETRWRAKPKRVIKRAEAVDRAGRKVGIVKTFDDGTKVQENLNGVVIRITLDGTRIQTNPTGTVIISHPDGSKRQQDLDGKVIETSVDGEQVQIQSDGTRIVLNPKDSTAQSSIVNHTSMMSLLLTFCGTFVIVVIVSTFVAFFWEVKPAPGRAPARRKAHRGRRRGTPRATAAAPPDAEPQVGAVDARRGCWSRFKSWVIELDVLYMGPIDVRSDVIGSSVLLICIICIWHFRLFESRLFDGPNLFCSCGALFSTTRFCHNGWWYTPLAILHFLGLSSLCLFILRLVEECDQRYIRKITHTHVPPASERTTAESIPEPEPEPEPEPRPDAQPEAQEPEPEPAPTRAEPRAEVAAPTPESKREESDDEPIAPPPRGFETVARVLAHLGEAHLLPTFQAQLIDDDALPFLEPSDLIDLGVAPMTCLAILGASAARGKEKKLEAADILDDVATHQSVLEEELREHRAELERLRISRDELPEDMCCPITCELMKEPYICVGDSNTYERVAVEQWFATGARTSPTTNERLDNLTLIPNHSMKRLIAALLERRRGT